MPITREPRSTTRAELGCKRCSPGPTSCASLGWLFGPSSGYPRTTERSNIRFLLRRPKRRFRLGLLSRRQESLSQASSTGTYCAASYTPAKPRARSLWTRFLQRSHSNTARQFARPIVISPDLPGSDGRRIRLRRTGKRRRSRGLPVNFSTLV